MQVKRKASETATTLLVFTGGVFAVLFAVATWDLARRLRFTVVVASTATLAVAAVVCFVGAALLNHLNRD